MNRYPTSLYFPFTLFLRKPRYWCAHTCACTHTAVRELFAYLICLTIPSWRVWGCDWGRGGDSINDQGLEIKFRELKWLKQLKFENASLENQSRHLCFSYTKVGKVRFKPRSIFSSWVLSKQMHSSCSGFKCFSGGGKPGIISFKDSQKQFTFIKKCTALIHSCLESKLKFEWIWQNLIHIATELFANLTPLLIQKLLRTLK